MRRTLTRTSLYATSPAHYQPALLGALAAWILASKLVKIAPHFAAHPGDLCWLPAYLAFAYAHSFIKLYCAATFWDHGWNGRNLALTQMASVANLKRPDELRRRLPHVAAARPNALRGTTGLYGPVPVKMEE